MCEVLNNLIRERDEALAAVKAAESIIQAAKKERYLFLDIAKAFHSGADSVEKLVDAGFDEALAKEVLSHFD